ncbi:hypothetical protein BIT28_07550 [Photobacterium proteolyticum]|uniref:Uncharacterized protein n=1 Tax=Photobacterium proteolyticum TaxID=1903952 RepID=A0A1Q9G6D6_9GAMM|nr:hypothetical protein [Photobacterium proteolyticum]OLQ69829.1 hypothetical protein BIT28_07550 [Photobacterium proteolyticum]
MANKSLNTEEIIKIEALIRSWQTRFTWDLLVERLKSDLDITTTRQTLKEYPSIKTAYDLKKQELRGVPAPTPDFVDFLQSDVDAYNEIQRLKAENEVLQQKYDNQLSFIKKLAALSKGNPSLTHLLQKVKQGKGL